MDELATKLDLHQVMDRNVENLSGGELQRFAIAVCVASRADVYMVDEPSSYLDVRQRLKAAQVGSSFDQLVLFCVGLSARRRIAAALVCDRGGTGALRWPVASDNLMLPHICYSASALLQVMPAGRPLPACSVVTHSTHLADIAGHQGRAR